MHANLTISVDADDKGAILNIDGQNRYIDYDKWPTEEALRALLADEPAYIVEAVLGMLKGMAK